MYIFDAHSHFGNDFYNGEIKIDNYLEYISQMNINMSLLMPTGSPSENNQKILKIKYDNSSKKFIYFPSRNPFIKMNYDYYDSLKKYNRGCQTKLIYIPYVHPVLDDCKLLEQLFYYINPCAIKINGVQSCVIPREISQKFIKLIKYYDIPLIIHTQYQKKYDDMFGPNNIIKKLNHPYEWGQFLIANNLKGILNHGAGLDPRTLELIKDNKNILIGLGPDQTITDNRVSVIQDIDDQLWYLHNLKKYISANKLVFDLDYHWNLSNNICNNDVERIKMVFNEQESQEIFSDNLLSISKKLQLEI